MIIKKITSNTYHIINQIDHAHLAYKLASRIKHIHQSPYASDILAACKHHDDGWEKSDKSLIMNPLTQLPYSFLNLPTAQHLTIWNESLSHMKKHSLLTQYFITSHLLHLATTYEAKKEKNNAQVHAWITDTIAQQNHLLKHINQKSNHHPPFQHERMLIQTVDELSLRLCMGSLQVCTLTFPDTTHFLHPQTPNHYTLSPYPFENTDPIEIPYRVYKNKNLHKNIDMCIIRLDPLHKNS